MDTARRCEQCSEVLTRRSNEQYSSFQVRRFCSKSCANTRPLRQRFEARFVRKGRCECWEWTGQKNPEGYGRIWSGKFELPAHYVSFELYRGPLPKGMVPDHTCENPGCVNPWHLEAVTMAENTRRSLNGKRKLTGSDVEEIRVLIDEGIPQKEIAQTFNVDQSTISNINTGKSWRAEAKLFNRKRKLGALHWT